MPAADATHALTGIFDGLTGFSRVAVAVSGGSDSMALLHLVVDWKSKPLGPASVIALTVDHGLRAESADEAEQVKQWCAALGLAHHTLIWSGEKPSTGIQAKARSARYDLMCQWCRQNNVAVLMTGHTADDQAETVLMRQQRTSSDRSLAAIWPENEWLGIKLFRPLLNVRRQVLRDYLLGQGQSWLEDPSNNNDTFERVRIRKSLEADHIDKLQAVAKAAQQRVKLADVEVKFWLKEHLSIDDYAVLRFPRAAFLKMAADLQTDILSWVVRVAGAGEAAERASLTTIAQWISQGRESRRSASGAIVSARRHVIEVMREPARVRGRFTPVDDQGAAEFDGRFLVSAPVGSLVGAMEIPASLKRPKDVPALAFAALPVVKLADGSLHLAVKSRNEAINATLCERFRL